MSRLPLRILLMAASIVALCPDAAYGDIPVSLPEFHYEGIKKHTAPDDEEVVYSSRPTRTLQLRRARSLLAAGHYEEAITQYSQGANEWKVPAQFRTEIDREWGFACERLGKDDEAIQHYKAAGAQEALAKLLIKLNRYGETKAIAGTKIVDCLVLEKKFHGYDESFPEWLRIRAIAEAGLNDDKSAAQDLEDAAKKYLKNDSEKADLCIREANVLIKRSHLGEPFKLDPIQLPQIGKDSVIELVKYMASSSEPFSLSKINAITGSHLKVPGILGFTTLPTIISCIRKTDTRQHVTKSE